MNVAMSMNPENHQNSSGLPRLRTSSSNDRDYERNASTSRASRSQPRARFEPGTSRPHPVRRAQDFQDLMSNYAARSTYPDAANPRLERNRSTLRANSQVRQNPPYLEGHGGVYREDGYRDMLHDGSHVFLSQGNLRAHFQLGEEDTHPYNQVSDAAPAGSTDVNWLQDYLLPASSTHQGQVEYANDHQLSGESAFLPVSRNNQNQGFPLMNLGDSMLDMDLRSGITSTSRSIVSSLSTPQAAYRAPISYSSNAPPPVSSNGVITRVGPYVRPYFEYALEYSAEVSFAKPRVVIPCNDSFFDGNQKAMLFEIVRRVRPHNLAAIRTAFAAKLTAPLARELLSGDAEVVRHAVQKIYIRSKETKGRGDEIWIPWMTGLRDEERVQVIEELADATFQGSDVLREKFLERRIPPNVAIDLLNATSVEERQALAQYHQLYFEPKKGRLDWNFGLSDVQSKALIQRLSKTGITEYESEYLLSEHVGERGFGRELLRADHRTFLIKAAGIRRVSVHSLDWRQ
jgi:hypothetical protein